MSTSKSPADVWDNTLSAISSINPATPPPQRSIHRQESRLLAPRPSGSQDAGSDHEYLLTDAGDRFSPPGKGKKKIDTAYIGPVPQEGKKKAVEATSTHSFESQRIILQPSEDILIWDAPPNLRSPLTGIYHCGYLDEVYFSYLKTLKLNSIL